MATVPFIFANQTGPIPLSQLDQDFAATCVAANNLSELSATASVARANLGLGSMATQGAGGVNITGGTIANVTISSSNITGAGNTISNVSFNAVTIASSNLVGLGNVITAATINSATLSGGTITNALIATGTTLTGVTISSSNLFGLGNAITAAAITSATEAGGLHQFGLFNQNTLTSNTYSGGDIQQMTISSSTVRGGIPATINAAQTWTSAQAGVLTTFSGSVPSPFVPDFARSNNWTTLNASGVTTLTSGITLAFPTNVGNGGQSGSFTFQQSSSGNCQIVLQSGYLSVSTVATLGTTANQKTTLGFLAISSSQVVLNVLSLTS